MIYKMAQVGLGTLYAMPCPLAEDLNEQLIRLKARGINRVISLLEIDEARKLGVADEAELCRKHELGYENFPIRDFSTAADPATFRSLVAKISAQLVEGDNIVVHCYAGIGRTGILVGATLIENGFSAREAAEVMSSSRGKNMPQTQEQYEFLVDFETSRTQPATDEAKHSSSTRSGWWKSLFMKTP